MDTILTTPKLEPEPRPAAVIPTKKCACALAPARQKFTTPKRRQSSMQSSDLMYGHIPPAPRAAARSHLCRRQPSVVSPIATSTPTTANSSKAEPLMHVSPPQKEAE